MSKGELAPTPAAGKRQHTKDKLKAAARALFARYGIEGVTVREILVAAGEKNGASLNYHFGKKEELVKRIAVDIFGLLNQAWGAGLKELDERRQTASIRDLIALIVNASAILDQGSERTSLRLIDRLSQERQHLLSAIAAEYGHSSYRSIMLRIAALQPDIPAAVMAHRAIFLTRYLSTIMAMYEEAQTSEDAIRRRLVGPVHDLGNVIDTAVGIVSAPIVDGGQVPGR